ncbi:MAG: hypothetical protein FWG45_00185 [Oscillospiraceae bacterium]|nr:hypothetical protein [Oscillospiraceae bacterium]
MKKNMIRKVAWGLYLLGAAGLILANSVYGWLSFVPMLCLVIVTPIMFESLLHLSFGGVFIPAAVLLVVFAKSLGVPDKLVPFPIIAAAVLLTIGFYVLFPRNRGIVKIGKFDFGDIDDNGENFGNVYESDDGTTCTVKFGRSTKYFVSDSLEKAYLKAEFGAIVAYFDGATLSPNGATLYVDASFSGIELYIPRTWEVQNNISAVLGGVDASGRHSPTDDSPTLTITGRCSLSGISIHYI